MSSRGMVVDHLDTVYERAAGRTEEHTLGVGEKAAVLAVVHRNTDVMAEALAVEHSPEQYERVEVREGEHKILDC